MNFQRSLTELFHGITRRASFHTVAASLALTGLVSGQTVPQIGAKMGINGNGGVQNSDPGALLPTDQAGGPGYVQTNWNNFGRYGADAPAVDSSGATTTVTFSWDSNNLWSEAGGGTPTVETFPDFKLMNGYLDSNGNQTNFLDYTQPVDGYASTNNNCKPWVYVQGLNAWMTANNVSQYDVVVYTDGDNAGGRGGQYWIQNATGPWTAPGMTLGSDITTHSFICVDSVFVTGDQTYYQVPPTVLTGRESQAGNWQGNVLTFNSLTNDSFLLRKNVYNTRAPVNAVQIVPRAQPLPATIDPLLPASVYSTGTAVFRGKVAGIVPMSFQWLKNGAPLSDGGNTSGSLTEALSIAGVSVADAANYSLVVSNVMGAITSSVAPLTVTSPTPGSYAEKIFTNGAVAYWQLSDMGDPSTNYAVAIDRTGGFNGTYESLAQNAFNGVVGPQAPLFPGLGSGNGALQSAAGVAHSWVIAPPLNLSNNNVTITAWIYPTAFAEPGSAGLVWSRNGGDVSGLDYQNNNNLGYTWNNNSGTYNFTSGLIIPSNMWSFVAVAVTPTNATLYLFNANGISTAVNNLTNAIAGFSGPTTIGDDPASAGAPSGRAFTGSIAQAAVFNNVVPSLELYNMYKKALGLSVIPASITKQPQSLEVYAGRPAVFTVGGAGDTPLTYQWQTNGVNLVNGSHISGANSAMLIVSNTAPSDATSYDVVVNNVANQPVTSIPVTLTVVASNSAPVAFEAAIEAANPLAYWRFNEPSGSLYAYDYWGGDIATNENVTTGVAGPQPPAFPGFETTNSANSYDGFTSGTDSQESILNNLAQFTIMGWFNPTGFELARTGLFGQPTGIGVGFFPDLGVTTPNGGTVTIPQSAITPGQWYMVAAVGDGKALTLYLATTGSVLQASTVLTTTNYGSSPYPFRIGGGGVLDTSANFFSGQIDEVAVFNHALTPAQLSAVLGAATTSNGSLAPVFTTQPASLTLFAGRTARFSATALATAPVTYQWQMDGTNLIDGGDIAGSTTESLTVTGVTTNNAAPYALVVANPSGSLTSLVATLTVIPVTPGSYESQVVALQPVAYYPLDETNDPSSGMAVANDPYGGNQGTYGIASQNGFNGIVGPRPPAFVGFDSNNFAVQMVSGTPTSCVTNNFGALDTNTATFTMWLFPTAVEDSYCGLEMNRLGGNPAGFGYTGGHLGYTWNNNAGTTWGATWSANLVPPTNQWSFVALVVTPTNASVYMSDPADRANLLSATTAVANVVESHGGTWFLGNDTDGATRTFTGSIDDAAIFNYALTPAQLQQLNFVGSAGAPVILTIERSGTNVILTWSRGVLQSASSVNGPYSAVTPAPPSPYPVPATAPQQYYRVLVQ